MEQENIMTYATVTLDETDQTLVIIDQTQLPAKRVMLRLSQPEDIWQAIHTLQVRGAPAIGVAAAIGLYAAAYRLTMTDRAAFCEKVREIKAYLATARPTAVNLFWQLARMERVLERPVRKRSICSKNGCMMKLWRSRKRILGSAARSANMV